MSHMHSKYALAAMDVHFADSFGMHLLHAAALIPVAAAASR